MVAVSGFPLVILRRRDAPGRRRRCEEWMQRFREKGCVKRIEKGACSNLKSGPKSDLAVLVPTELVRFVDGSEPFSLRLRR